MWHLKVVALVFMKESRSYFHPISNLLCAMLPLSYPVSQLGIPRKQGPNWKHLEPSRGQWKHLQIKSRHAREKMPFYTLKF